MLDRLDPSPRAEGRDPDGASPGGSRGCLPGSQGRAGRALGAQGRSALGALDDRRVPAAVGQQALSRAAQRLDVMWTMTTVEREQQARAIRVPLFKGLFGWRLLLAVPAMAEQLRQVRTLDELRRFSMVQGLDWPDTGILRANGLQVIASPGYDAMFKQLRLGRADAFPRGIEEIWWEQTRHGQGLVVVPDLCLHYPAAIYFFLAPGDDELAGALELCLQRLRASGAFDRLFLQHHGNDIARAQLGSRHVIELHNPLLPKQTPLDRPELWFQPTRPGMG